MYWLITFTFVGVDVLSADVLSGARHGPMVMDFPRNAVIGIDPGEWLAHRLETDKGNTTRVLLSAHQIDEAAFRRLDQVLDYSS